MDVRISPATSIRGAITLPGDKSISHRCALLAAIAEGETRISNYSSGADCRSTLEAIRSLGAPVEQQAAEIKIVGRGLSGLRAPERMLDAGNSGSTIRMLSGVLAAQPFTSRIGGDESLSRRPMDRIMKPLAAMGATIQAREGRYPPLEITGARLRPIDYSLPVASAQVKTCVLLAGLFAPGTTVVREPVRTRDHTEIALAEFGAEVTVRSGEISVSGGRPLRAGEFTVPGDLSSAAFFLAAALMAADADLLIEGVGLNPTRSALLDFLTGMGADLRIMNVRRKGGELAGDLRVRSSRLKGGVIDKTLAAGLIDEIPVLAVLGAATENGLIVRDASELRVKETDRIATVAENLRRMGAAVKDSPDGLEVAGRQSLKAAELDSFGDHRVAMAFAVAALASDGECLIRGAEAAEVSYPEFFATLRQVAG